MINEELKQAIRDHFNSGEYMHQIIYIPGSGIIRYLSSDELDISESDENGDEIEIKVDK